MAAWLDFVLFNMAGSGCLALMAWWVSQRLRRPALAHTLWLLALLKLVTPPLLGIEGVPRIATSLARVLPSPVAQSDLSPEASAELGAAASTFDRRGLENRDARQSRTIPVDLAETNALGSGSHSHADVPRAAVPMAGKLLFWALLAGATWIAALTVVRAWRFRQRIQGEPEAPEELRQRAASLGRLLGISHLPRIRVVSQWIPPSLWLRLWRCEILLPAQLLPRLTQDERDMLLAHELAHVRRRDHWIRPLEQLVVALYWWNPLVWWARRHLRVEEEKSCDALVLQKLPGRVRAYAEGLLKSIEFLAMEPRSEPALVTGAGTVLRLEERMKAILSGQPRKHDSRWMRALFVLPAALALTVAPAWVGDSAGVGEPAAEQDTSEAIKMHREELLLQKELQEVEARHSEIQMQIEAAVQERERARMRQQLEQLEQEGRREEAEELRRQIAMTESEAEFNTQQARMELEFAKKRRALEFELQELALQRDELLQQGDKTKAAEVLERAQEIQLQLRHLQLEALRAELERSRQLLGMSKQQLESLSKP